MEWIETHLPETVVASIVVLSGIIQFSPIKLNPWSWFARSIGKSINKDVFDEVSKTRKELEDHIKSDEDRFAKQCRLRILRFNDEILQGSMHSKEHFDEVLDDITEYERHCETHPGYKNSKAVMAIANVEAIYQKCLAEKSFL